MKQAVYKRAIAVTLHRRTGKSTKVIWVRYFNRVTTAIPRGVELALLSGQPGDVLEFTSSNYGYLIATIKLNVGAKGLDSLNIDFAVQHSCNPNRIKS